MTEAPETSETPSGHLRWRVDHMSHYVDCIRQPRLQQMFYRTTYRGTEIEQTEVWRDVPVVAEEG